MPEAYARSIALRPEHATYWCEMHTAAGACPWSDNETGEPIALAEPIDLDRGFGFDAIGSALCAGCICDSNGNGEAPRAVETTEIVPVQEVAGLNPIDQCEFCSRPRVFQKIYLSDGEPNYGIGLCTVHRPEFEGTTDDEDRARFQ